MARTARVVVLAVGLVFIGLLAASVLADTEREERDRLEPYGHHKNNHGNNRHRQTHEKTGRRHERRERRHARIQEDEEDDEDEDCGCESMMLLETQESTERRGTHHRRRHVSNKCERTCHRRSLREASHRRHNHRRHEHAKHRKPNKDHESQKVDDSSVKREHTDLSETQAKAQSAPLKPAPEPAVNGTASCPKCSPGSVKEAEKKLEDEATKEAEKEDDAEATDEIAEEAAKEGAAAQKARDEKKMEAKAEGAIAAATEEGIKAGEETEREKDEEELETAVRRKSKPDADLLAEAAKESIDYIKESGDIEKRAEQTRAALDKLTARAKKAKKIEEANLKKSQKDLEAEMESSSSSSSTSSADEKKAAILKRAKSLGERAQATLQELKTRKFGDDSNANKLAAERYATLADRYVEEQKDLLKEAQSEGMIDSHPDAQTFDQLVAAKAAFDARKAGGGGDAPSAGGDAPSASEDAPSASEDSPSDSPESSEGDDGDDAPSSSEPASESELEEVLEANQASQQELQNLIAQQSSALAEAPSGYEGGDTDYSEEGSGDDSDEE